jgi:uncharacterized membrane protein
MAKVRSGLRRSSNVKKVLLAASTLWCLSIIAAPLLGLTWVDEFFSRICHQEPERSWQLFGRSLPVCIRCASIYFAFTLSLWLELKANVRWLRVSVALMLFEFAVARLFIDAAPLRSLSGILVGLSAAPFVKQGIEEIREAM